MNFMKKIENVFAAVAFAEAGEVETARQILREDDDGQGRENRRPERARPEVRREGSPRPVRT
jgi:hypothetical protein